jgi:hemerythrin-like domain-containing protein
MLRDKNLIPLSHQHQHALAVCVRIDRSSPVPFADLDAWQAEVVQHFESEIRIHFEAEEKVLFPAAHSFDELVPLVEELLRDHSALREGFTAAERNAMSVLELSAFAQRLSEHIRKEERQLFQRLQELLTQEEMAALGKQLERALEGALQVCIVPAPSAKTQSKR